MRGRPKQSKRSYGERNAWWLVPCLAAIGSIIGTLCTFAVNGFKDELKELKLGQQELRKGQEELRVQMAEMRATVVPREGIENMIDRELSKRSK